MFGLDIDFAGMCKMLIASINDLWELNFNNYGSPYPSFRELAQEFPHSSNEKSNCRNFERRREYVGLNTSRRQNNVR